MFKLKIGNVIKEYNLKDEKDSQLMLNNLFLYYSSKFPFFINVLITMSDILDVQEEQKEQLAYTYYDYEYERIKIHINYDRIQEMQLPSEMIMFLIFHEYLHNYYYHFQRMKEQSKENPTLANIVMDYYVNELLYELFPSISRNNFKQLNLGIIDQKAMEEICKSIQKDFPYTFNDKPLEPIMYDYLKKEFKMNGEDGENDQESSGNNGSGTGNGNSSQGRGKPLDNHEIGIEKERESMDKVNEKRQKEGKPKMSEQDMQSLTQNKMEAIEKEIEQNQGIGSGDQVIIREKEKLLKKNPFLNTLKLKRIINSKLKSNTIKTYKRISRKRDNSQIIFKGKLKQEGRKVVVALDVSGSISDKDLKMFYEMLNGFLSDKKHNTSLDVIYWSDCDIKSKLNFHQNIKDIKDLMKLKTHSSGGTDISYLHNFIKDYYGKNKEKIVLINITDGQFYINDTIPKECIQYYFILTEKGQEENIINNYPDSRVKVKTIKEER